MLISEQLKLEIVAVFFPLEAEKVTTISEQVWHLVLFPEICVHSSKLNDF